MKTIVVDIDNTIIDQVPRKIKILNNIGVPDVDEEVIRHDFNLDTVLHGANRRAFFKVLLGPDLQQDLTAFPGASKYLNELAKDYRIVYISARPSSQQSLTTGLLERLGFPKPDEENVRLALWPLRQDIGNLSDNEVNSESLEWKRGYISGLVSSEQVVAAISDTSDDVSAFATLGVPSILFHSHGEPKYLRSEINQKIDNPFVSESIQFASDWQRVASLVRALDRSEEELATLVTTHSAEYASFLSDLDAKARLLLIIATFLGASFFTILWHAVSLLGPSLSRTSAILCLVLGAAGGLGLAASLLAMTFSIRAFGSRHTRGTTAGRLISLGRVGFFFRNFIPIISGRESSPPGSPVEEAQLASRDQGSGLRRLTHLAFFQRHYGTYDPALIRSQRMLDLRAMNYGKIYPEIYARNMLFVAIALVPVCIAIIIVLAALHG
ncbi:MAG: 5' nucleotidase, NT5C type [Promethearchaeati archaeon]